MHFYIMLKLSSFKLIFDESEIDSITMIRCYSWERYLYLAVFYSVWNFLYKRQWDNLPINMVLANTRVRNFKLIYRGISTYLLTVHYKRQTTLYLTHMWTLGEYKRFYNTVPLNSTHFVYNNKRRLKIHFGQIKIARSKCTYLFVMHQYKGIPRLVLSD